MTVKLGWLLLGLVVLAVIASLTPRLSAQALQSPLSPPCTPLPWRPTPAVPTPTAMSGTPALIDAPLRTVRQAVKVKVTKVRWSYQAK